MLLLLFEHKSYFFISFIFFFATEGTKMLATTNDKDDGAPKSGEKEKHKTVVHQVAVVLEGVAADEIKLNPDASQLVYLQQKS
jgi:hypothetical protein